MYSRLRRDPDRLWDLLSRWPIFELAGVETHHPQTQTMQLVSKAVNAPFERHWYAAGLEGFHVNDSMYLEARLVGAMNFGGLGNHELDSPWKTLSAVVGLVR